MENNLPINDQELLKDVAPGGYDISYEEGGKIIGFDRMDKVTISLHDRRETREAERGRKEGEGLKVTVAVFDSKGKRVYLLCQSRVLEDGTLDASRTTIGDYLTPDQIETFKRIIASRGK